MGRNYRNRPDRRPLPAKVVPLDVAPIIGWTLTPTGVGNQVQILFDTPVNWGGGSNIFAGVFAGSGLGIEFTIDSQPGPMELLATASTLSTEDYLISWVQMYQTDLTSNHGGQLSTAPSINWIPA